MPNKQVDADKLLKKYKGSESTLLAQIYVKYLLADERGDGTGTPFDEAVARLYDRYAPDRSGQIPGLIDKYQNRQDKLIVGIVNKYEFRDVDSTAPAAISYKTTLSEIYRSSNPEKLSDVDALLVKYKGKEGDLVRAIKRKYGRSASSTSTDAFKSKLTELYKRHNPDKISLIDNLAVKYKDNQAGVLAAIEARYHPKRNELVNLYTKYNPDKVNDVDQLLIKYKGREDKLIQQIKSKYVDIKTPGVPAAPPSFVSTPTASIPPPTQQPTVTPPDVPPPSPIPVAVPEMPISSPPAPVAAAEMPISSPPAPVAAAEAPIASPPAPVDVPETPVSSPPAPVAARSTPTAPPPPAPATPEEPAANEEALREAERLKAQQEAEAKRIAQDEANRKARDEAERKAAADLAAKQLAIAEEQKRKVAARKQIPTKSKDKKKKSLVPLIVILAIVVVLAGGGGGYYYKFGFTFPFFSDKADVEEEDGKAASLKPEKSKASKDASTEETKVVSEVSATGAGGTEEENNEEEFEEEIAVEPEPEVEEAVAPKPKATPKAKPKPKPVAKAAPVSRNLKFHLAAGSFSIEQNALALHRQLKSQGYDAVYLGRIGDYYKVSYQSFNSESDARSALQSLKDKGVSSWVLKHELN